MNKYSPLDLGDFYRRTKRNIDNNWSYRKLFLGLVIFTIIFLYGCPRLFRWMFTSSTFVPKESWGRCMDERLTPFYSPALEFDAHIRHSPRYPHERNIIPFVGNGYFGLEIEYSAAMYINGRWGLQVPTNFQPIVSLAIEDDTTEEEYQEATVVEYQTGIVHRFHCSSDQFFIAYQYYAHRNMPHVFVQELRVVNMRNQPLEINLNVARISAWPGAVQKQIKLQHGSTIVPYQQITGLIPVEGDNVFVAVGIVYRDIEPVLKVKKRGTVTLNLLTTVVYSEPMTGTENEQQMRKIIEAKAVSAMDKAIQDATHRSEDYYEFRKQHIKAWNSLWQTGFHISTSKAENALNGDRINSTIYAVLSHVRAYEFEESITPAKKEEIAHALTYTEGCYDSYHTLDVENLWRQMSTVGIMNEVVRSWLMTLEKHGCHKLIKAGASGIIQAMVLSFGGFRFSNAHLEFRIHPKYLHRDYEFRRLNYGDMTHINVTVEVTEDNKAVMYVALDRSGGFYYACDAGCLDEPIRLGHLRSLFPVKLTDPLTAILYITADRQHIEDLQHVIHVKEVIEAPAHEHHVIALHRHGHHLGGLPPLFWFSIVAIIIIFHVFLCKLIAKEFFNPPEKMRYRYSKP